MSSSVRFKAEVLDELTGVLGDYDAPARKELVAPRPFTRLGLGAEPPKREISSKTDSYLQRKLEKRKKEKEEDEEDEDEEEDSRFSQLDKRQKRREDQRRTRR